MLNSGHPGEFPFLKALLLQFTHKHYYRLVIRQGEFIVRFPDLFWNVSLLPRAPSPNCLLRSGSLEDLATPMIVLPDLGGELVLSVSHILHLLSASSLLIR